LIFKQKPLRFQVGFERTDGMLRRTHFAASGEIKSMSTTVCRLRAFRDAGFPGQRCYSVGAVKFVAMGVRMIRNPTNRTFMFMPILPSDEVRRLGGGGPSHIL